MHRKPIHAARRVGGFTVIELMAVIGIMITVLFITLPALSYVRRVAKGESVKAFVGMVNVALINYNKTYGAIPPSTLRPRAGAGSVPRNNNPMFGLNRAAMTTWEGANFLCQALTGASNNDGKEGLGYVSDGVNIDALISTSERVYDWNTKKFRMDFQLKSEFSTANRFVLTGIPGDEPSPILYYAKEPAGDYDKLISAKGIWSSNGQYSTNDNERLVKDQNGGGGGDAVKDYLIKNESDGGSKDMDRDGLERSLRGAKYLMVWTGIDFKFGTADDFYMTGP